MNDEPTVRIGAHRWQPPPPRFRSAVVRAATLTGLHLERRRHRRRLMPETRAALVMVAAVVVMLGFLGWLLWPLT